MKQKTALLAAILVSVTAPAATAEEAGANKPEKRDSRTEEKTTTPKVMQLRDWEELFGHKHTEGEANMPMPEPVSGASQQETMQPMQKHDDMQEKH